ncbi:MAG TPA: IS1380 family transposase [Jatrophihabitantaceae bacterium]|nr:IS1380 family transposase [Jatrophihabitantaceae bacterium]
MQLSHVAPVRRAVFDDPSLVSSAGLVPVLGLAHRAGLGELAGEHLTVAGGAGSAAGLKVSALVAGMVAGADSIDDMDLLRHGAMGQLFVGVRAPSTLGTFLRAFRFGHVRQLDAVAARTLAGLARHSPIIAASDPVTYLDMDDTVRSTFGYAKQGAGYGYSGVKGLNALLATVSTASSAPLIVATRLRKGSANSARGAARLVADAIKTTRSCGVSGLIVLRADSAYYGADVIAAARRHRTHFSVTARKDRAVTAAIASIPEDAWTTIRYPRAIFDDQLGQWVSDAEVAEIPFTAFASKPKTRQVTARLIVRRVRDANPDHVHVNAQGELFPAWRHHAVFTNSPLPMLTVEADHRRHAIIEQVIADLKNGPLAHLPSGSFAANSAWLVLAAIAFNLTRAAGALASTFHARATTATIRAQLISVAARVTRSARRSTLRLPAAWPWAAAWQRLFTAATGPPALA